MKQVRSCFRFKSGGLASFATFLLAVSFVVAAFAADSSIRCDFCGKTIQGGSQYIRSDSRNFCSEKCFNAWAAQHAKRCAACGKPVVDGYLKDGKAYCSMACLSTTLPKCAVCGKRAAKGFLIGGDPSKFVCQDCGSKPKCAVCGMPGELRRLDDGRQVCQSCFKNGIFDQAKALEVFSAVRKLMGSKLGVSTWHPVKMSLIGQGRLTSLSGRSPGEGQELGLFEYSALVETRLVGETDSKGNLRNVAEDNKKTDESWRIYALYGLPEDRLAEVFAHELAHDWMQENCPNIKDPKLKEGWAEYIAWRVNALLGRQSLNSRIESNEDPVYGGGFRKMRELAERDGFNGLKAFLVKLSNGAPAPRR